MGSVRNGDDPHGERRADRTGSGEQAARGTGMGGGSSMGKARPKPGHEAQAGMEKIAQQEPSSGHAPPQRKAQQRAAEDVAHVVHSQVDPGVSHQQREAAGDEREPPLAQDGGSIHGHAPGVGGVAGDEAVKASAVVSHVVQQGSERRVVGGSQAHEERLEDRGGDLVAQADGKGEAQRKIEQAAPV